MIMNTQAEKDIRQALRDTATRIGIMEVCRRTGLARWTVRRLLRGKAVNPGTFHHVAAMMKILDEPSPKDYVQRRRFKACLP